MKDNRPTQLLRTLMVPGPVQPQAKILAAMSNPLVPDYGQEWTAFYRRTIDLLKGAFSTGNDALLLVGSGSSGLDACIGSAMGEGEKVLVGVNGFFGERLREIAEHYGLNVISVDSDWRKPLDIQQVEDALKVHEDTRLVAIVHVETSTGIVNPVPEITRMAKKRNVFTLVDSVSSLGGMPFLTDEWEVDYCVSASQKCLGVPPGLSPIAISPAGWKLMRENRNRRHGWYLDLLVWERYASLWSDWHPYPITMPTNLVTALKLSLEDLMQEGLVNRQMQLERLALRLRNGLRSLGMVPYAPDDCAAPVMTTVSDRFGAPTSTIVKYLAENHNITIAGGLGSLRDRILRIGHMTPVVSTDDIDRLLYGLKMYYTTARR